MKIWGRRPPLRYVIGALALAVVIGVALRTVLSLVVAGAITAVLVYVGLMLWIGFSRRDPPR